MRRRRFDKDTRAALCDTDVRVGVTSARKSMSDCTYVFEIPAGNPAVISANAPGYAPATVTVSTRHDKDACGHAIAVDVDVELVTRS